MHALTVWPSVSNYSPSTGSSNWGRRRSEGFHGVLCTLSQPKRCRTETSLTASNCNLKRGRHRGTVDLLSKQKKKPFGLAFALHRPLNEPVAGKDGVEEDDSRQKEGIDQGANSRNKTFKKIDVRKLALSLRTAETADDVEEVLKKRETLPLQVYSTIIKAFGKEKRLVSAMALFKWLKLKSKEADTPIRPNIYIFNHLLEAMKQAEKYDDVEEVIAEIDAEGVLPNVVTYNTLMSIYIEQGREIEALQLFEEMQSKQLSPSPVSYSTVLFAYRRLEDGFGALAFFVNIRTKYHKGEIKKAAIRDWDYEFARLENFTLRICYQVMRRWLVTSENLSTQILKLLNGMDDAGLKHGCSELERLVLACTHAEQCVVAKEVYSRMREVGTEISVSVCNRVIWLMGKAKKLWVALEIYEEMLDRGPKPNDMSSELIISQFNTLLTAAREKGIWRWGMRLINKMEEKGLRPSNKGWNSVLVACSKASETLAAIQTFKRMVDHGEKPTIISYVALLSALEKGKLYDEALQVWKHMMKVGVEPNLCAYTIMASICAIQGKFDTVDSIIQEMIAVGIQPTVITYNAIISGCARTNQGSTAHKWFLRMKLQNVTPNEITYDMLIEAVAHDGKPRLAYDLYLSAQNEGRELSTKAYDAIIYSSERYGTTVDISSLGSRPPERKKKARIRKHLSEFCKLADVPRRSQPFEKEEILQAKK